MSTWDSQHWPGHSGNWGRWPNDRGAMNLIGPDAVRRGMAAVRSGEVHPCSRPLDVSDDAGGHHDTPFVVHEMIKADEGGFEEGDLTQSASERLTTRIHGMVHTHIDALAHMGYRGRTFNGYAFPDVVTLSDAAKRLDITASPAIVTRALFVDVPRSRGVDALEPGDSVQPADLEPILGIAEPGDAAVIRVGGTVRPGRRDIDESIHGTRHHGTWAGLDTDCVEVLAERDIAVIATDSPGDTFPHRHEEYARSPVHVLAEVFYGIPLIHNMDLEAVGDACAASGQQSFLLTVAPLHLPRGTGSLVTPIAVL